MLTFALDEQAWVGCHSDDRWLFNKLELSKRLGYKCGPACVPVPAPGEYIVRPCINLNGMGKGAHFLHIEEDTDNLPVGTFWCEKFSGQHLSIDYEFGKQVLCVEGTRHKDQPIQRFNRWAKVEAAVPLPDILKTLKGEYRFINIEMIGGNIIEVHLRDNPDFRDGATCIFPVWNDDPNLEQKKKNRHFVSDPEVDRVGFLKYGGPYQ